MTAPVVSPVAERPARTADALNRAGTWAGSITLSLLPVLVVLGGLVLIQGGSPIAVVQSLYEGSFGSMSALSRTLHHAAPLMVVAVGAVVAQRGGLLNIGQEGQVLLGAAAAAAVALEVSGSMWLAIPAALIAGSIAGGLWAGVAALLKARRGIDEVISTLLLTFIATQVVSFALNRSWLLQESGDRSSQTTPRTDRFPDGFHLPEFPKLLGLQLDVSLLLAVVAIVVVPFVLRRSAWGFRVRTLGANPRVAHRVGIDARRYWTYCLVLSGALAGAAGAIVMVAGANRFDATSTVNIGWEGILVALIARERAVLLFPAAVLFGALETGSGFLLSTGVPPSLADVAEGGFVIAAIVAPLLVRAVRGKRTTHPTGSQPAISPATSAAPATATEVAS